MVTIGFHGEKQKGPAEKYDFNYTCLPNIKYFGWFNKIRFNGGWPRYVLSSNTLW